MARKNPQPEGAPTGRALQDDVSSQGSRNDAPAARRRLPGTRPGESLTRCGWCGAEPLYVAYHDVEWGVPLHDDRRIFEMLVLEGAQDGLNWLTVLRKREAYRAAFDGFDAEKVATYGARKLRSLLANPGIIRNRQKIEAAVGNARAFLAVQEEFGSFDGYVWRFVGGAPKQNAWKTLGELPAATAESEAMSRDLRDRGFRFVGPTICYAHMQATGMVNDHLVGCFRHREVAELGEDGPAGPASGPTSLLPG
ncbi:MAG: DNA-3-methyladenine glycosylase I [Gemmatimonadota bacterium]